MTGLNQNSDAHSPKLFIDLFGLIWGHCVTHQHRSRVAAQSMASVVLPNWVICRGAWQEGGTEWRLSDQLTEDGITRSAEVVLVSALCKGQSP